jgi:hypothetical protein
VGTIAEEQGAGLLPPRKSNTWAVTVDSTARAYDISKLAIGGFTPEASLAKRQQVVLYMQAQTNDVFFYFHSATDSALSDTAAQSAGAADAAFVATHCAVIKAGSAEVFRIDRTIDKFLVVKAASTSGILRVWAYSESR